MDHQHYQQQQSAAISDSYYHFRLTSPFPPPSALALKIKFLRLQANISRHTSRGIRAALRSIKDVTLYKSTIRGVVRFTVRLVRGTNNKKNKMVNKKAAAVVSSMITVHILAPIVDDHRAYYNADWNSVIPTDQEATPLSGYLEWLEDRSAANDRTDNDDYDDDDDDGEEKDDGSDINRRAESFIARCYEKFKLEKQESYRRYQEMMARSL